MSGRYPAFPEYIREKFTVEFLEEFKSNIDNEFINDRKPKNPTYWNYYQRKDNTGGFYKAFENTCEKQNELELLNFMQLLPYPDSDILYGDLTVMLYKNNLIELGDPSENWRMYKGLEKIKQLLLYHNYKTRKEHEK